MTEGKDFLGRTLTVGDAVAFPHSECHTLVTGKILGVTPKQFKIQCESGHKRKAVHTFDPKDTPEVTYRNHSNCIAVGTESENQLVESVAAVTEMVLKLQKQNDALVASMRVIKTIKTQPAFGDLSLAYYDDWAKETLDEAGRVIDREMMNHRIYA